MASLPLDEFPGLSLEPARLPRHVAIVMDGNGRWASQRGLTRSAGHRRGKDSVRAVVEAAREIGIPYLTLFVFSNENWQRPSTEVRFLMELFHRYLVTETKRLMKRDIRVIALGDLDRLPPPVRRALDSAVAATANNRSMTAVLALSYGGRQDVAQAARRIAEDAAAGRLRPEEVDEQAVGSRPDGGCGPPDPHPLAGGCDLPDPDLLIRTSGEQRISNFFLYQLAYTELYFTNTLWPDFRERDFLQALVAYQQRERRFGALDAASAGNQRLRAAN